MADWADLPEGLLDLIAQRTHQIKDLIVIDSVCKSWQFALTFDPPKFPLLMLAEESPIIKEEEDVIPSRCFFNLFTSKIFQIDLPEVYARKCLGVGFGWLLTVGMDLKFNLLHPFLRHQICLPQSTFTHQQEVEVGVDASLLNILVKKAVLSCSPRQESCNIMIIYGAAFSLAFARVTSTDKSWIDVPSPSSFYGDIIYYKEQFYAVDYRGSVVVCDIDNDNDPRATFITTPPPIGLIDHDKKYLVESSGDLLLISRIYGGSIFDDDYDGSVGYFTLQFLIFKMEESEDGTYKWVEVNVLGNRVLFLGNNSSVSFSVSPEKGLKANCIYFTDDNDYLGNRVQDMGGGHDMAIFNMRDGTIERHYEGRSYSKYSPPLWYI